MHRKKPGELTSIMMVIPSLLTGGSERVFVHIVRHLDRSRFKITVIVLNNLGALAQDLPNDVEVKFLGTKRTAFALFGIYREIRRVRPDILFTTLVHLNLLVSILRPFTSSSVRFVARESNTLSASLYDEPNPGLYRFLLNTLYRRLDCVICQCEEMKADLVTNFGVREERCRVINNPVDVKMLTTGADVKQKWNENGRALISIGTMRRQKGYDRLVTYLSRCEFDYKYIIIGDGGLYSTIKAMIGDANLGSKIELLGSIARPYGYLASADCLLLGSYYEGFPNVVVEALALGVPVIAWSSPGGHNEIIENGKNGWLVNSGEEFRSLLESRAYLSLDRQAIATAARERYDLKKIISMYEQVLLE